MVRTNFYGPNDVQAVGVRLYSLFCAQIEILAAIQEILTLRLTNSNQPTSTESNHSLHWLLYETLQPWLSNMCPVKILIRLSE